jgi:hypothetical protein
LQSTTLSAARFNAKLIDRASDLINEGKLDETQAGLITLAMIFLLLSKSSFSLNKSSTLFGIYTPGTFFNPLTPPEAEALCMFLPICL